jgi:TusA-related sulfurtransferase
VKAKKEADTMAPGAQLEVTATDPGSVPDFQGRMKTAKHALFRDQRIEEDDTGKELYVHLLERT